MIIIHFIKAVFVTALIGVIVFIVLAATGIYEIPGSLAYREKNGLVKNFNKKFHITSIRVDDDAEYHITAYSNDGQIFSISDASATGWINPITIRYANVPAPVIEIDYDDSQKEGHFYENRHQKRVILPIGFKIDTFDD